MSVTPGKYDITIYQGVTYSQQFIWKDENGTAIDLTTYTARLQARKGIDSTATFLDLTTANGGITLGGTAGTITLSISATDTEAITVPSGVYDLELINGTNVCRLLQGSITVSREVTR